MAVGPRFFGMGDWDGLSEPELETLARAGVGSVRLGMDHTSRDPSFYDGAIADAARHGIEVFALLTNAPVVRGRVRSVPPLRRRARRAWTAWAAALAERYGPEGEFWEENPALPYVPIRAFQVWNEPNLRNHWLGARPSPRSYMRLLGPTARAIRRAQPRARIVLAGIPNTRRGIRLRRFLGGLYRRRGFRRSFDVAAAHPYGRDVARVEEEIETYRAVLRRHRDGRRELWISEIGWATDGARHPFKTTLQGQADRVHELFGMVLEERTRWRLGRVYWFALADRELTPREQDWWGPKTGLFSRTGFAKPAWRAFVNYAGGSADERLGVPYLSPGATRR
jgi:hypothetical protein